MEPVEINAGSWYLRALRADDRIDDRPALAAGGISDPDYVAAAARGWAAQTVLSWAVCEPTTADMVAEVRLLPAESEISGWARDGYGTALDAGVAAVRRFAAGALGLAELN